MTFKDDLKDDLQTFVAASEFAELINLDGVTLPAQVIRLTKEKSARLTEQYGMLHGDFTEIHFMTEPYVKKYGKLKVQGQWLWFNGRRFDIMTCREDLGICHMILAAYRQDKPQFRS